MARTLSRRHALELLAIGGAGAMLSSCTDTSDSGGGDRDTGLVTEGSFDIPEPPVPLPTADSTLRWIDSGDQKAVFFDDFFSAYREKHPNIEIDYESSNWNQITQVITIGLRNGTAPDVFQLPCQLTAGMAVSNDWVGAYDDIIPDLAELKKRFPPGMFANGITDFNGKTYGIPLVSAARVNNLLLFNTELTRDLDVDLSKETIDWDQFRKVCRDITKQGAGNHFGIVFGLAQPGQLSGPINAMVEMAGVHGGAEGIDYRTGTFNVRDPLVIEAIELMLAIKADGSAHPDSPNLDDPAARARMPQGQAGIIIQGPWNIPIWQTENPDFSFDLNLPPQHLPDDPWPITYGPGGAGKWFHSANTKLGPVIGHIMSYMGTMPAQVQWALHDGAADPSPFPEAINQAKPKLDALQRKALDLGARYTALRPEPAVRNPEVTKVYESQLPADPSFSDTLVGLYTGEVDDDVPTAMKKLADRLEQSLEDAIATAKSRGAKVSRDDWVFSDWDPKVPYTKPYED